MNNDELRPLLHRLVAARNEVGAALAALNQPKGEHFIHFALSGKDILAMASTHAEIPAEVHQRCDIITRTRADGSTEWLKNRDNPLPEPTDPPL